MSASQSSGFLAAVCPRHGVVGPVEPDGTTRPHDACSAWPVPLAVVPRDDASIEAAVDAISDGPFATASRVSRDTIRDWFVTGLDAMKGPWES